MRKKVPFNTGMVVDSNGGILRAWKWGGKQNEENPCLCEQDDGGCIELTKEEHDLFNTQLHIHRYDFERGHIVNLDTGLDLVELASYKNKPPGKNRGEAM